MPEPELSSEAGDPVRLAIWGSCVTRDTLEVAAHSFGTPQYHARTSWVSQASGSAVPPVPVPSGAGFGERMVREDLTSAVVGLVDTAQPHVLVIDLIDERFDVVDVAEGRYTVSDYVGRAGLEAELRERASRVSRFRDEDRQADFAEAVDRLAPELLKKLPDTRIVLHQAWFTARSADPDAQQFYASAPAVTAWANNRLAGHYATLRGAFAGRLHVVEAPRELLIGDPAHRWGLAHYHYVPGYYESVLAQLEGIAGGPVAPPPGASVPPADTPDPAITGAEAVAVRPPATPVKKRRKRSVRRIAGALRRRLDPRRRSAAN